MCLLAMMISSMNLEGHTQQSHVPAANNQQFDNLEGHTQQSHVPAANNQQFDNLEKHTYQVYCRVCTSVRHQHTHPAAWHRQLMKASASPMHRNSLRIQGLPGTVSFK